MRISSGVPGFDDIVEGGFPEGRLYVVSGPPGSGKTTFCAQFAAEGARADEKTLFVSMHETKRDIIEDMAGYEFGFDHAVSTDRITFLDALSSDGRRFFGQKGERRNQANVSNRLTAYIDSRDVSRVVFDSTMLLHYLLDDEEDTAIQFLSALKRTDATTILISEMTDPNAYSREHYLAHGVVFMHNYLQEDGMERGIQVLKMRGTDVDTRIHDVGFGADGLEVGQAKRR
ncbi:gas vesicle protein GvpD [Halalkaliarchaeum sp. AArc-GB]|uniref:RAD55 family ATPase n=1 Tax=unclassified Halalkaliarchaeum TaxID=2678344 RepID=UPI00217D7FD1|nr:MULTISPECIES: ATPase domain-containing protein [unclassified Halalkaliarchaeum]MDR5674426.1 gas vesicle protein GvpD [Halalkaliarchaeum sp. AArc-GB]